MHTFHNPEQIAGPFGHYEHGVETALPGRLLHVSGQIGVAPDGAPCRKGLRRKRSASGKIFAPCWPRRE